MQPTTKHALFLLGLTCLNGIASASKDGTAPSAVTTSAVPDGPVTTIFDDFGNGPTVVPTPAGPATTIFDDFENGPITIVPVPDGPVTTIFDDFENGPTTIVSPPGGPVTTIIPDFVKGPTTKPVSPPPSVTANGNATMVVPTTTGHNTVQPTACNLYPTGTTIVINGTTSIMAATAYATWVQGPNGKPTTSILFGGNGPAVITSTTVSSGTTTQIATPTITTLFPDATNGGVYTDQTITSTNSGGGVTTITNTGYGWPTACMVNITSSRAPAPTKPAAGGEALRSSEDNSARSLGVPVLVLGAVAGIVAYM